jgi:hypothetical protein
MEKSGETGITVNIWKNILKRESLVYKAPAKYGFGRVMQYRLPPHRLVHFC